MSDGTAENGITSKKESDQEPHKPIIRKFEKRKVYSSFIDNILGTDLTDMQLISTFNKGFRSLLSVFDNNCKYAWVTPLKDKKGITIADYNTTINEIEKKIAKHDHSNKYITTQEFDKLTSENFALRLAQANLAGKNGTDNFVNKIYFNNKLKKLNKKVNSNNTSHAEFNTKLDDLERNVKIISTKGLTADMINKYSILNGPKYFFLQMDYKTIQ